jgi:hypothetical protein
MTRKTKDKSPATMPSETPRSEAEWEALAALAEPALTARFEALPNKPRNSLLYKPREISAATGKSLAKRFESPAGFTTPMSDEEKIAALTAKDTPQVLTGCVGLSQRLYWILRGIAELPVAPMPRKRINGVKPSESFITDWNAGHPAYDGALSKTYLRDEVEFWIKSCRAAWRAVELAAIQLDGGDTGISRWSIQAKTAVSRLSHVLGNPAANRDYFFAELLRHLRRYPDLLLPDFYRCVDDLAKLVTVLLVVRSPGEVPQMDSPLSPQLHPDALMILRVLKEENRVLMSIEAISGKLTAMGQKRDEGTIGNRLRELISALLAHRKTQKSGAGITPEGVQYLNSMAV